ncbi:hypothetical protein [Halobacteriovorax marinus]|uniref:hypothetical protein n=1 Tax=Halobacteriovorax marinus TaxID=97084 RepID=UPI003A8EB0BA
MREKRLSIQFVTQTATDVIKEYQEKVKSGELTEARAMELLDQVSHKNNDVVISTEASSKELQREADDLIYVVEEVRELVNGKRAA